MSRKRKTPEEYYNECKSKGYDLPIEDYKGNKIKIKHKCNKCENIYSQIPSNHLKGHGCPICYGLFKKTSSKYYNECKDKGLDLPIEDYKNAHIKIKHKCAKGHIYEQTPNDHLRGRGCPICGIKNISKIKRKTSKEYREECKSKGYDLPIEEYKGNKIKIKYKCSKGHIYLQSPNGHLNGQGCPICYGNMKKTPNEYYNECKEKGLDLPIEDYTNVKTKIKHRCSKGHIYTQTPDMHIGHYRQGCPICNESHGEKYIKNYLDKNNIEYIPQKRFHDLKDKTYLSYDFYLPNYNMLIEYQGIQHYESISFNGKDSTNLENQQYHDKLKKEYAKDNGYKLLELKYTLNTQDLVAKYLSRRIKG